MNKKDLREHIFKLAKCELSCVAENIDSKTSNPDKLMMFINDNAHAGIITEEEYENVLADIDSRKNSEVIKKCLGRRMDNRTFPQYGMVMYKNGNCERGRIKKWFKGFGKSYFPEATSWRYTGASPSGRIIFVTSENPLDAPDIKLIPIKVYVEYKDVPCTWKSTFKWSNILAYAKYNAHVALVYQNSKTFEDEYYGIITPESIKKIIKEVEKGNIGKGSRREVGNKDAIQFYHNISEKEAKDLKRDSNNLAKFAVPAGKYIEFRKIT